MLQLTILTVAHSRADNYQKAIKDSAAVKEHSAPYISH